MPYQLWYGQELNLGITIIHSTYNLMKHAETLTGGMLLMFPSTARTSHNRFLLHQRDATPLPTSRARESRFRSCPSHEASTYMHVFNRIIIMSTGLLLRTNEL
jgi:hypothetical protein